MKTSLERTGRPPLSVAKAWTCLLINGLICPGLGSLLARRLSGFPQLVLTWGGAIWMAVPLVTYFSDYVKLMQKPPDGTAYVNAGLGGLAFFLAGWMWSILTGLLLVRRVKQSQRLPADLPPRTMGP